MKRPSLVHSFIFAFFLILASCGSDNKMSGSKATSESNSFSSNECGCNTAYAPVCATNTSGNNISYNNQCIANCYKATTIAQGNCECSEGVRVCGTNNRDYSECEALIYNVTIKKYGTCSSASY